MSDTKPGIADFDELLGYLPALHDENHEPILRWGGGGGSKDGVLTMPWPEYEERVSEFFRAAARACWSDPGYEPEHVGKMIRDPQRVARASLREIKSMLTWCVRGERFCDGHWGQVIKEGYVRNILLRLRQLRPA